MKHLGIGVTIGLALLALAVGYGRLQMNAERTATTVERHEERIDEAESINLQQSTIMERNLMLIDKMEKKYEQNRNN